MTASAQVISAEARLLGAGRAFGQAKYAEANNDRQSALATGRYLDACAELVHAATALWQADEDTRNRKTMEGLRELAANAPGMTGVVAVDLSEGGES